MIVGALADAGADQKAIVDAIASLQAGASVSFEKVKRCGIAATKYHVAAEETQKHRHLSHIVKMIESANLTEGTRRRAIAVFQKLGEAEAQVHSVPIEKVHFHEVGAADSIADIVGAAVALDLLGIESVVCSPVNVGSGTVKTEHGILPVPAPATVRLLNGAPVYSRGPEMELTTPTGAAVAATLAARFGAMPPMKITAAGYGAGTKDFTEHANVLRVIAGEPTGAAEALTVQVIEANIDDLNPQVLAYATGRLMDLGAGTKDFTEHANVLRVIAGEPTGATEASTVQVIEANIDDLNPQVLAYATGRLMDLGALDVSLEPIGMKKGRA